MSSFGAAIAILAVVVISFYELYKANQKLIEEWQEESEQLKEEREQFIKYEKQVKDLKNTLDNDTITVEESTEARKSLYDIQQDLIEQYSEIPGAVSAITKALDVQNSTISENAQAWRDLWKVIYQGDVDQFIEDNSGKGPFAALARALDNGKFTESSYVNEELSQMGKTSTTGGVDLSSIFTRYNQKDANFKELGEAINKYVANSTTIKNNGGTFYGEGEYYQVLKEYQGLIDLIESYSNNPKASDSFNNTVSSELSALDASLEGYKKDYEDLVDLYNESIPTTFTDDEIRVYENLTNAYDAYSDAISEGADEQTVSDAKEAYFEILENAQGQVSDKAYAYFEQMNEDLSSALGEYEFEIDITANTDGISDKLKNAAKIFENTSEFNAFQEEIESAYETALEKDKDLTMDEFLDSNAVNDFSSTMVQAYQDIYDAAYKYGIEIDDIISKEEDFGNITSILREEAYARLKKTSSNNYSNSSSNSEKNDNEFLSNEFKSLVISSSKNSILENINHAITRSNNLKSSSEDSTLNSYLDYGITQAENQKYILESAESQYEDTLDSYISAAKASAKSEEDRQEFVSNTQEKQFQNTLDGYIKSAETSADAAEQSYKNQQDIEDYLLQKKISETKDYIDSAIDQNKDLLLETGQIYKVKASEDLALNDIASSINGTNNASSVSQEGSDFVNSVINNLNWLDTAKDAGEEASESFVQGVISNLPGESDVEETGEAEGNAFVSGFLSKLTNLSGNEENEQTDKEPLSIDYITNPGKVFDDAFYDSQKSKNYTLTDQEKEIQKYNDAIEDLNDDDLTLLADNYDLVSAKADEWINDDSINTVNDYNRELARTIDSLKTLDGIEVVDQFQDVESVGYGPLATISDIYDDVKDGGTFDYSALVDEDFTEAFSNLPSYNNFIKTITENTDDINACQDAFNKLTGEMLFSSDAFADLTDDSKALTIALLDQQGIENSEEVTEWALGAKNAFSDLRDSWIDGSSDIQISTNNLNDATETDIHNILDNIEEFDQDTADIISYWTSLDGNDLMSVVGEMDSSQLESFLNIEGDLLTESEQGWLQYYNWLVNQDANTQAIELANFQNYIQGKSDSQSSMMEQFGIDQAALINIFGTDYQTDLGNFNSTILAKLQSYKSFLESLSTATTLAISTGDPRVEAYVNSAVEQAKAAVSAYYKDVLNIDLGSAEISLAPTPKLKGTDGSDSGSDSGSDTDPTTIDWIEQRIDRINRKVTKLGNTVDATWKSWGTRNKALKKELKELNTLLENEQKGAEYYKNYADEYADENSSIITDDIKKKVANGSIDISEYDSDEAEIIQEYLDRYTNYLDMLDSINETQADIAEKYIEAFENVATKYESLIGVLDSKQSYYDATFKDSIEATGDSMSYKQGKNYYGKLNANEEKRQSYLEEELEAQIEARDEYAAKYGKKNEEYKAMESAIWDTKTAIQESKNTVAENTLALKQIKWDEISENIDAINHSISNNEFLASLFESQGDLYTDTGKFTKRGKATLGTYEANIKANQDALELAQKSYNNILNDKDAYNEDGSMKDTYREQLEEFESQMQDSAKAIYENQESIKSLWEEMYNELKDSLDELISTEKDNLQTAKDLYDYQKSIQEKSDTITDLEMQIRAYEGDNSEENQSRLQQLYEQLDDAQEDLNETEWSQYISDVSDALDDISTDFEDWLETRLDDTDGILKDTEALVAANYAAIIKTSKGALKEVNLDDYSEATDGLKKYLKEFLEAQGIKVTGAYATGSKSINKNQLAWTQEKGQEIIYRKSDGAMLTPLGAGDAVFTAEQTAALWNLSKGNIPGFANGAAPSVNVPVSTYSGGTVNNDMAIAISLPGVTNYDEFVSKLKSDGSFEKFVQQVTIGKSLGKNSLLKNRY